jgi:GcrA cell cycle regulator
MTTILLWSGWDEAALSLLTKLAAPGDLSTAQIAARMTVIYGVPITRNMIIGICGRRKIPLTWKHQPERLATTTAERAKPRLRSQKHKARPAPRLQPSGPSVSCTHAAPLAKRSGAGLAHLDLRHGQCRWPHGEPADDGFHFCAATTHEFTASYCAEHKKMSGRTG